MSSKDENNVSRTTVRLDVDLLARAKSYSREHNMTLTALIEDALKRVVYVRPAERSVREKVSLPVFSGDGLCEGVDLDDSAGLLDLIEQGDDSL